MLLKKSFFAHEFVKGDYTAIYNALNLKKLYFHKTDNIPSLPDYIDRSNNSLKDKILKKLISNGIYLPVVAEELDNIRNKSKIIQHYRDIEIMYLFPTDFCNYQCRYCFIENPKSRYNNFSYMSKEVAKKGIDYFFKQPGKEKTIIFYGGEPLLNEEIIRFSVDYININYNKFNLKFVLVTNGSKVNKSFAEFVAENKIKTSVSLDGPKKINDTLRVFKNNKGTYDKTIKGFNVLKDYGALPSISCTIHNGNIDELSQIAEFFAIDLSIEGLGFNILHETRGVEKYRPPASKLATKFIEAFEVLRKYGIYEDRMMRSLNPFVEEKPHLKDCSGCGNQIVLKPNGKIGVCQLYSSDEKFFIDPPSNEIKLEEHEFWKEWVSRAPLNIKECYLCPALSTCGGGCPASAERIYGTIWNLDEYMCEFNKSILEWMIWDLLRLHINK